MSIDPNNNAADFDTNKDDIFGRIASRYDALCDLFSLGIHRVWKNKVAKCINQENWNILLDTASGTGDIVLRVLKQKPNTNDRKIIASDISPQMLTIAKDKIESANSKKVEFAVLDAENLYQIESNSIDCYSMSLGLKICNRKAALEEALRVLKPKGRIVTLEASNIPIEWVHKIYLLYMKFCMPIIGWIATSGDSSAYKYLLNGINDFPSAEELKTEFEEIGFVDVIFTRHSFGIVAIHVAQKP